MMKQRFAISMPSGWLHDKTLLRGGLGISLLLLCGVGVASYLSTRQLAENRYWVEHTYQVVHTIDQVDSSIKDVERGRRGYVLTQNQEFLQIYRNGIQTTESALNTLANLTVDNPQQQQRLAILQPLIEERIRSLQQSIELTPGDMPTQAAITNQGIEVQQTIQTFLQAMKTEEQALLQQRSEATDASLSATKLINILGYSFSFALLTLIYALLEQEIRQHKQTGVSIKQYADEVEDLYNNAPCGYHSLSADGNLVRINDTELKWLGYDRSEVIGKQYTDLLTPQSRQAFAINFPKFIEQGWISNLEFEVRCKDGSILPVEVNATALKDASGHYIRSRSTLVNIRERKQAEAALRNSEAKFRSLSEAAPIGIFMADAQGYTTYTNRRAQEICGYSLEEALGYGWIASVHPDDFQWMMAQWKNDCVEARGSIYNDVRFVHRDGSIRYGRIQSAPIVEANGRVLAFVGTIEDITESRTVAQMKSEFISTVSHELRTPLTAIRGSLGLLAAGVYDSKPEKAKRMVQVASEQSDRLVRLINDILDFQRLESGKVQLVMQFCNAATLLQQAVETMRSSAEQSQITFCLRAELIQVWASPDAILQTLTNLLSNAIKFSSPQTMISVAVEQVGADSTESQAAIIDPPDCCSDACSKPANLPSSATPYALFTVRDRGRGIPADKLDTIFEQFQQVDASDLRQKGGTGLGLAICRKIIQQHGGTIWAESALGEGSSFYFTLPLVPNAGDRISNE